MINTTGAAEMPDALRLAECMEDHVYATREQMHEAAAELRRKHARIAELEAQLETIGAGGVEPLRKLAGFDAADMATAAAQGFRDGVASIAARKQGATT